MQKKALGRGLESLIPVASAGVAAGREGDMVEEISLGLIAPNPYQPRRDFDEASLRELGDSLKTNGVIQPVLVRRLGDGQYELIAGERRVRAARLAGLDTIACIVRHATNAEAMEMALIENLQRKDLNPMEAARAYQRLMKEFGFTQEEVSQRLGKERSSIANTVRLLSLPLEVQRLVEEDRLSLGHAKVLLALAEPDRQLHLARRAVTERLSVRDLERLVRTAGRRPQKSAAHAAPSDLEERLMRHFGTHVRLIEGKVVGKIVIEFYSRSELDRILDLILG